MKDSTITLHYFNPETDYALACGRKHYNPPKKISTLKRRMQLFPATFAKHGDFIMVDDPAGHIPDSIPYSEAVACKDLSVISLKDIPSLFRSMRPENMDFKPWGWNHSLLHLMLSLGMPTSLLKSEAEIDTLRKLSHRRTSITLQLFLSEALDGIDVPVATECADTESAMDFLAHEGDAFFKMPWSSSGRGVIHASEYGYKKTKEWVAGAIRKQGSVLAEKAFNRSGDFASEWVCKNGKALFLGLSLFHTTPSGRYSGNVMTSQDNIWHTLCQLSPFWNQNVIDAQKKALDVAIAPHYSGPVGIDMLSTGSGELNPLVEINLRQTMGMAAIISWNNTHQHIDHS